MLPRQRPTQIRRKNFDFHCCSCSFNLLTFNDGFSVLLFLKNVYLSHRCQGVPGNEGPMGPTGVPGCNGTKVQLQSILLEIFACILPALPYTTHYQRTPYLTMTLSFYFREILAIQHIQGYLELLDYLYVTAVSHCELLLSNKSHLFI